jgi:hypothetical protein
VHLFGTSVLLIDHRDSESHWIPEMEQFRANRAHNSCSVGSKAWVQCPWPMQVSRLNTSRHSASPSDICFTEHTETSKDFTVRTDRRQLLHCRPSYCLSAADSQRFPMNVDCLHCARALYNLRAAVVIE